MKAKPSIKHPRAGPRGAGFERPKERPNIALYGGMIKAFLDWGSGAGAERHGQLGTGSERHGRRQHWQFGIAMLRRRTGFL